jgi:hypothetical protein
MNPGFLPRCLQILGHDRAPTKMRTPACHLLAGRPGSEAAHLYGGQGTASDWRSGLWVEVVAEVAEKQGWLMVKRPPGHED